MTQAAATTASSAFDRLGGHATVRAVVDRFYDLMDQDPAFADLRALHARDLGPMRDSLTGFLTAWLGGPRDWFAQNPNKCMMSAHRDVAVSRATGQQWADAMGRAVKECVADAELAGRLSSALGEMAVSMGSM